MRTQSFWVYGSALNERGSLYCEMGAPSAVSFCSPVSTFFYSASLGVINIKRYFQPPPSPVGSYCRDDVWLNLIRQVDGLGQMCQVYTIYFFENVRQSVFDSLPLCFTHYTHTIFHPNLTHTQSLFLITPLELQILFWLWRGSFIFPLGTRPTFSRRGMKPMRGLLWSTLNSAGTYDTAA